MKEVSDMATKRFDDATENRRFPDLALRMLGKAKGMARTE